MIDDTLLGKLAPIDRIVFYKRDEITSDLICCEVSSAGGNWTFHEEMPGWDRLIAHVETLPGFRRDWHAKVAQPAFEKSAFEAFVK